MAARTVPPSTVEEIVKAIQAIRYGYVQITIQDSRVVQIEKTEKIRMDRISRADGSQTTDTVASVGSVPAGD